MEQVPPKNSIPLAASMTDEQVYEYIIATARKAGVYRDQAHDVAVEGWLKTMSRGYYDSRTIREAARNIGLWRESREIDIDCLQIATEPEFFRQIEQRSRINAALRNAPAAVRAAAELMISQDMDACDAARAVGISACALSRGLARCGQLTGDRRQKKQKNRKTQPTLFGEVAA